MDKVETLEEFSIPKITYILDETHDIGHIQEDVLKFVFITLPKKEGAADCELNITVCLKSHVIRQFFG